jgi:hypothetical protein
MSNTPKSSETVRLLAEQAGLQRALQLFPDGVAGAVERGSRPLAVPADLSISPVSAPAAVFDPAKAGGKP